MKMEVLVSDFVMSLPNHVKELRQAQEKSDWDSIKSVLHQLKGMGTSFGFPRITELAVSIEGNLRNKNKKQSINELSQLLIYMDVVTSSHDNSDGQQRYGV